MEELFGIPMNTIMWVLLGLFGLSVAGIAVIALSNRTMFRMGLRNIPRRGTQTVLVIVGLMLSTLIVTAAFTTGDTINHSITKTTYDTLQRTDIRLDFGDANADASRGYVREGFVPALEQQFAGDPDIERFMPVLLERAPVLNPRTRLSEPSLILAGVDTNRLAQFGGLRLVDGGKADLALLGDNQAFVSEKMADELDVRTGDSLTVFAQNREWPLTVVGIVKDELASGVTNDFDTLDSAGGLAASLATVQRITGHSGLINWVSVALKGDIRSSIDRTDPAVERLEGYFSSAAGKQAVGLGDLEVKVDPVKQDSVNTAETFGNIFTTVFLVLGLFSVAAGILLIFMIFVMLAAERKTEMGMARAIGAKRVNLIQMFASEGMAYDVLAGAVGAALGVGAAFTLLVGGMKAALGDQLSFLEANVTPRTLIISYCLGVVLTFITVIISAMRVSQVNIVAAIRGTDDARRRESRRRTNWKWVGIGIPALIIPPLGVYFLLRRGFGLPNAWVWGPFGIIVGILLMIVGQNSNQLFPFALGISLIPLSVAPIARYYHAPNRPTWTIVGVLLSLYWLMPDDVGSKLFGDLNGNIEMFVLSGIMIVIGFTLILVFNARLLTTLFQRSGEGGNAYRVPAGLFVLGILAAIGAVALGDRGDGLGQLGYLLAALLIAAGLLSFAAVRFPRLAPAMKMGVAYPLANRFRTGMTIAMFSLIMFSIVVMSTLNANFAAIFSSEESYGSWDIVAESNINNPLPNLPAALREEGSFDTAQIADSARATSMMSVSEVRQAGQEKWENYPVRAGDAALFSETEAKLEMRARGYDSDRAVYSAVASQPNLALMDALPIPNGNFGGDQWKVKGVKAGQDEFDPFQVEVRDPVTGKNTTVTIIGVFSTKVHFRVLPGIFVNESTYTPVFGAPDYRVNFLRLTAGADSKTAAKGIKAAMLTRGVQAFSIQDEVDTQNEQSVGFSRIFQGFMALGLFVGIAALGVIAFRSVVERRQQIGMLRAIGYQRGTVALTFLLESSFIALMGILSGVIGAAILSRNLMTSDEFTGTNQVGFTFFIPWTEVIVFVVAAYVFSLLLTWWPSRGAAKVPIAEALRYE